MALGYVIGHVFMYLAFLNIGRLFFSIVPRLNDKESFLYFIGLLATIGITLLNAKTMIWGNRPAFDEELGVTLFNVHPAIGAAIGIFAALTVLPTAILMIVNGATNHAARTRSYLLGGGLLILITAGPVHDLATTASLYMIADIASMVGLLMIAGGVAYRIEERIALAHPQPHSQSHPVSAP